MYDDVDGFWVDGEFYKVGRGTANACNPTQNETCEQWNGDPESPNSPLRRGAKDGYGNLPPANPPVYRPPPPDPWWEWDK